MNSGKRWVWPAAVHLLLATSLAGSLRAHDEKKKEKKEEDPTLTISERIEIKARGESMMGVASSAAEGTIGREDLERRPVLRNGELLETVPGLVVTQHSGSGKANQYFLRGFNLDHGTDFRIEVAGMQVNNPTHGHGQGYADINFLIPELIETIDFRKGPYFADVGDFSTAGSTSIHYVRSLDEDRVELTLGSFGYGRALAAGSFAAAGGDLLAALELVRDDGPWRRPDDAGRVNGLLRFSRGDFSRGFSLTLMAYDASWNSTDQIPLRAVESGLVDRLGLLEPDAGGETSRYSLSFDYQRGSEKALTQINAHVLRYELDLFSNFTYFLDDASRLPGEPAEGVEDIHFHPAVKASARLVATWRF